MRRLTVIALVLATATSTWLVTKRLERAERTRLEKWGGDAEMRARRAEQRAEGYRRLASGKTLPEADGAGPPSALATGEFPEQDRGEIPKVAQQQAAKMAPVLGLSEEQTQRLTEALTDMYRAPTSSASPMDQMKETLRPILNAEQWKTLVASLENRDPQAMAPQ